MQIEPVHDFPNEPVMARNTLCWDIPMLFNEVKQALRLAGKRTKGRLDGIGVDSWGVDFCQLDSQGELLGLPCTYRDKRTDGMVDIITQQINRYDFYMTTGVQLRPIHTICQLLSMVRNDQDRLRATATVLNIAEAFIYRLTGKKIAERTMVEGSGLIDVKRGVLCGELLERFDIPKRIFPPIVSPGTIVGELLPPIARETGIQQARVIAPACHDTANLMAALPIMEWRNSAFMSSGTWGVVGRLATEPLTNRRSYDLGVTNMATWGGRYLNVLMFTNLWLIQECRRSWRAEGCDLDYACIVELATQSPAGIAWVDPDDPIFVNPPDMPAAIADYCRKTGQKVPQLPKQVARVIFESIALKCRDMIRHLEQATETTFNALCIVGGGARNALLNQLIADAIGKPVVAGPSEATAIGNIMIQAMATKQVGSLEEALEIVALSFPGKTYLPENHEAGRNRRFIRIPH